MELLTNYNTTVIQNKWLKWINSSIYFNELEILEEDITVQEYLETIFKKLFHIFKDKKIFFRLGDKIILNDVMNYYFHLWRSSNKAKFGYNYSLTHSSKLFFKQNYKNYNELTEYLDTIFTDTFWTIFKNKFANGYGLFDPELSEFGKIFWENIRYFLYQYVEIENTPYNIDNHEIFNDSINNRNIEKNIDLLYKKVSSNINDDPYLIDHQISKDNGNSWLL